MTGLTLVRLTLPALALTLTLVVLLLGAFTDALDVKTFVLHGYSPQNEKTPRQSV